MDAAIHGMYGLPGAGHRLVELYYDQPWYVPTPDSNAARGADSPDAFVADMIAAIVTRNDAALQGMMSSPFIWASWEGAGEAMAPSDAISRVQNELVQDAMSLRLSRRQSSMNGCVELIR